MTSTWTGCFAGLLLLGANCGAHASLYSFTGPPDVYVLGPLSAGLTTIETNWSTNTGTGQASFTYGFDFTTSQTFAITATLIPGTNVSSMFSSNWIFDPLNPYGGPNITVLSPTSISVVLPAGSYRFLEQGTVPNHGVNPDPVVYSFSGTLDLASPIPEPTTWLMLMFGFAALASRGKSRVASRDACAVSQEGKLVN